MTLSVLIATCNRPKLLTQCIKSILENSILPNEIIVIDQSDDSESELLQSSLEKLSPLINYCHVDWRGKSKALNHGLSFSQSEFLALTDDDVKVEPNWLETFMGIIQKHKNVKAFCGRVLSEPGTSPDDYLNLVLEENERWIDKCSNPISPSFCGANVFINREILISLGGYNQFFGPGEIFKNNDDGELAYRLIKNNYPILYTPELFVYHSSWRSGKDNFQLIYNYAYGIGALAGYYMRNGDSIPSVHLFKKTISKMLKLIIGLITVDSHAIKDNYIHIKAFMQGAMRGLSKKSTGTEFYS